MEIIFKRKSTIKNQLSDNNHVQNFIKKIWLSNSEIILKELEADLGLRRKICEYHLNDRDENRRKYLLKGPCQFHGHNFPYRMIGGKNRIIYSLWFNDYHNWLEYNIKMMLFIAWVDTFLGVTILWKGVDNLSS